MRSFFKYTIAALVPLVLAGCAEHDLLDSPSGEGNGAEIDIISSIRQEYESRANDGGFADGDAIGVYVVDYKGQEPGILAASANHATNVKFSYTESDGSWEGAAKLYWTDSATPVDAYGYYPFAEAIDDVNNYRFEIAARQDKADGTSSISGYEASDFLWAKAEGVLPGRTINLIHNHVMSSVQITLVEGADFNGTWDAAEKSVTIENTITGTTIDLATGVVSVDKSSDKKSVTPYLSGENYRAIVVPQTVASSDPVIGITIGGDGYKLKRQSATTFLPGKLHKFTIKVDKKLSGDYGFTITSESITDWVNDDVSHNAAAKVYTVIDCPEPGALEATVKSSGLHSDRIENLKLTGTMNMSDFSYFKYNFPSLVSLNLKELRTVDIQILDWYATEMPGWGIKEDGSNVTFEEYYDDALPAHMLCEWFDGGNNPTNFPLLHHVILPDNCKYIGEAALAYTPITGTLTIPEGVKWIGSGLIGAYGSKTHHITTLNLPTSVEYIGNEAFNGCEFTNELLLPDGLKYIGDHAFSGCRNTYGTAHIPEGLKYLGSSCFNGVPFTGIAVFPAGTKIIKNSFCGTKITGVHIPEGVEEIEQYAFGRTDVDCNLRGDIHLPNSIKKIGREAFAHAKINHINIPEGLEVIEPFVFFDCRHLMDSLVIPSSVRRIGRGAFHNCSNLSSIRIPASVEVIEGEEWPTFGGCYSLEELRCDAVVPPTLIGDPFSGGMSQVHKDNFTLVVPEQSVEAYQKAEYWREFKRISQYRNLVFRPQLAKVLNKGGKREVVLNADAGKGWTVTHCPEWLHISSTSGTGKSTLTITIDGMAHGAGNRNDEIRVKLQGTDHETSFKVSQFDYQYDEDQSYTIQSHTAGAGVDLVIIGDGYDAEDIANDTYLADMQQATEMFFDLEPFKTYRDYFNVYTAFAMSHESGIGSVNYLRNTKFSTSYGNGTHDSRISCAADAAAYYSLDCTPVTEADFGNMTVMLVANGTGYDGVTTMYGNGTAVAICPKSEAPYPYDWRGLIHHEACGHGFAKLADEYIYHMESIDNCTCICCGHVDALLAMQAMGEGLNLSLKSRTDDLPWKHLIRDSRVNDIVDVWEGGFFHKRGVYRSEYNSVMNNNVPYMSTWSRELAVRRIMKIAGQAYDYEKFIANDSREWGRDFTIGSRASASRQVSEAPIEGTVPVMVKGAPQRSFKGVRKTMSNHKH